MIRAHIFINNLPVLEPPSAPSAQANGQPKRPPSPTNHVSPNSGSSSSSTQIPIYDLKKQSDTETTHPFISVEPRKIGPMVVIGPAVGALGQPIKMTHICGNFHFVRVQVQPHEVESVPAYQYATWNDDGRGEYCLWTVKKADEGGVKFECHARVLAHSAQGQSAQDSPRMHFLNMAFAPHHPHKLLVCLRRDNQGCGLLLINTASGKEKETERERELWYRVCDATEANNYVCCKWTDTLLLGNVPSAAVIVKGKGMYELVDQYCASSFLEDLHVDFVNTLSNFVQVGRHHRCVFFMLLHLRNHHYFD